MATSARSIGMVAVVTGGNRGLGLETCRQFAERGMTVVLTSRDAAKGHEAARLLETASLKVEVHPLDVCDEGSVKTLARYLDEKHARLDVLVNNAGAVFDHDQPLAELLDSAAVAARGEGERASALLADVDTLRKSFEVNAIGAWLCCKHLVPLMRKHNYGRIVNVSSGMAALHDMNGGWPGYRMSKTALNALTRILASELLGTGIKINSVCPGWVRTDMGGPNAPRAIDEGCDTTVWLASLHDDGPSGGFFRDCKQIPW